MNKCVGAILTLLLLSGCSTIAKDYRYMPDSKHADEKGMVLFRRLELSGPGALSVKPREMSLDTRAPNLWKENVVPIFAGAVDKSGTTIGLK